MLKKWWLKFKKKSLFGKISDIFFYLFIIALLIPATRKEIMTLTSQVRMLFVGVSENEAPKEITSSDNFHFITYAGEDLQLQEYIGKPILINFWATWCPPCRAEMPSLDKLYADYGDKIHFLVVSNESFDKIAPYIQENGYAFPVYKMTQPPSGVLAYNVLPTTFILDKTGRVISREEGAANWNSKKVRELLDDLLRTTP